MNTNKLKRFATEARTKIKQGVVMMMRQWGFDAEGNVIEEPIKIDGGTIFRGAVIGGEDVYYRWEALRNRIATAGLKQVYEEAAYTWFNRFVAIKILSKNGLLEGFLDNVEGKPQILSQARRNAFPLTLTEDERRKALEMAGDHEREFELFTFLITSVCHSTPILAKCFGKINDYTELLLPRSVLTQGDFMEMLNNEEYISDDDFAQVELIGWLYQFYIAERKDEVFTSFKSGKKAAKEDIPAATQIFTPNWIVKYMVQNTIGRIYLDNYPDSNLASKWAYLVETAESRRENDTLKIENPEELTLADKGCGSGHILVEGFDVLFDIYKEQYASDREACESILKYNLFGVDIDTRAKQLAQFAILMKACKRVPEMSNCEVMPQVFDMPEPLSDVELASLPESLHHFFLGGNQKVINETIEALKLLQKAQDLGSVMKFDVSESTCYAIETALKNAEEKHFPYLQHLRLMLVLTKKYASLCMNPPYMGAGHMEEDMLSYVKENYPLTSNDLGAIFMDVAYDSLISNGKFGMINQAAWFFKPTYKDYRNSIVECNSYHLDNALYLGPNTFPELKGEVVQSVTFVTSKSSKKDSKFFHLKSGATSEAKCHMFLTRSCKSFNLILDEFKQFSGCQFGFWLNKDVQKTFKDSPISIYGDAKQGLKTGNNPYFIKQWQEVSMNKFNQKWYPVETGGNFRKWYGNGYTVLNWENDGYEIKNFKDEKGKLRSRPQGLQYSFKKGITWSTSAGDNPSFRYSDERYLFESSGSKFFLKNPIKELSVFCAYFNSYVVRSFIEMFSPGLGISEGAIKSLPFIDSNTISIDKAKDCIQISKQDWDAHETSWDFQTNELLSLLNRGLGTITVGWDNEEGTKYSNLDLLVEEYKAKWNNLHSQLHQKEEELNRQFIEIYGLQDELTPDVPLEEITILQQGEISIENNEIVWHPDVLMKQLISYAVGCMMGRYSIDVPGLILANQGDGLDEYNEKVPNSRFIADEDGILPILPEDAPFTDNIRQRMIEFISTVFGRESQVENLNFIENALGKSLGDYLIKDFWKDHKKMYQNRPIYWLFTSKKGAFQCITYMHRMDEYTLERIRQKYLLPYISHLETKVQALQAKESLTTAESRQLTKLKTTIEECREYHDRLHQYSQQNIAFDLDDGVVKNYALFGDVVAKLK